VTSTATARSGPGCEDGRLGRRFHPSLKERTGRYGPSRGHWRHGGRASPRGRNRGRRQLGRAHGGRGGAGPPVGRAPDQFRAIGGPCSRHGAARAPQAGKELGRRREPPSRDRRLADHPCGPRRRGPGLGRPRERGRRRSGAVVRLHHGPPVPGQGLPDGLVRRPRRPSGLALGAAAGPPSAIAGPDPGDQHDRHPLAPIGGHPHRPGLAARGLPAQAGRGHRPAICAPDRPRRHRPRRPGGAGRRHHLAGL
jgi:hypothetical protein